MWRPRAIWCAWALIVFNIVLGSLRDTCMKKVYSSQTICFKAKAMEIWLLWVHLQCTCSIFTVTCSMAFWGHLDWS